MDNRTVIVTGSAENLFVDMAILRENIIKPPECDALCVNRSVLYYPYFFQHWASLHHDLVRDLQWVKNKCNFKTHSNRPGPGIDRIWPMEAFNGDSGLFAVRVAVRLGYEKIILCGLPLDKRRKIYQVKENGNSFDCITNLQLWREMARDEFDGKVRSMSGNTREILGEPTKEWLNGLKS